MLNRSSNVTLSLIIVGDWWDTEMTCGRFVRHESGPASTEISIVKHSSSGPRRRRLVTRSGNGRERGKRNLGQRPRRPLRRDDLDGATVEDDDGNPPHGLWSHQRPASVDRKTVGCFPIIVKRHGGASGPRHGGLFSPCQTSNQVDDSEHGLFCCRYRLDLL
jgi:hypothetical protein